MPSKPILYRQLNGMKNEKLWKAPKTTVENINDYICIRSDSYSTSKQPTARQPILTVQKDLSAQYVSAQDTDRLNAIIYMYTISENKPLWILSSLLPVHAPSVQQLLKTVSLNRPRSEKHYGLNMLTPAIKQFITL